MIIAVDPGLANGLAIRYDGDKVEAAEDQWYPLLARVENLLLSAERLSDQEQVEALVVESYHISSQTLRKTRQNWSLEVIGALRFLAKKYHVTFVLQTPTDAKMFVTDDKLRKWGLWIQGSDHKRDAVRHLCLYLANSGRLDEVSNLKVVE